MTDSLLDTALEASQADKTHADAAKPAQLDIPQKFLDPATGELRVEALLKSYRELEKRLSQRVARPDVNADPAELERWRELLGIPQSPDMYTITDKAGLGIDPAVNATLHQAGFTQEQVQLVYDLAEQKLLPLIAEAAQQFEAERQVAKLSEHFGGEERFRRVARQLSAWGRQNLPAPVFDALSTTFEGVLALERMMAGKEPEMAKDSQPPANLSEEELRVMMRDPRYWRSREPAFVQRVTEGFRKLVNG
ncbi:hypothetical protein EOD42_20190 [Rhodovarius crocodyli]|uniref:Uncharacterized protein n=1 Tax=Rhodovarius crocodyli TaxID=1979269 RepID=A0A437M350_9PROT|nr:hypothetical protein [Rhodovarius crocodyli]RVT92052.1 hypothetical protein EOD42_20190 [Rhodovarius crocodyli]